MFYSIGIKFIDSLLLLLTLLLTIKLQEMFKIGGRNDSLHMLTN
jgi:hypothetical protein